MKLLEGLDIEGEKTNYVKQAKAILKGVGNLRLIGETGVGKTTLVEVLSEENDWELYSQVLSKDTTKWDLLASDTLKDGNTEVRKGIITRWLEDDSDKGKILYLDGWNYCSNDIKSITESLTDFRGKVRINELNKEYKRTENHYVIISLNPRYFGTNTENKAQKRRFESVRMKYLHKKEEAKYLSDNYDISRKKSLKLASFAEAARKAYLGKNSNGKGLSMPITLGNLKHYTELLTLGDEDLKFELEEIPQLAANNYPREEKETVLDCWGGINE
ncbi:MAG: AAA family ATPase [archaeon]